ncbi:bacteriocin-like protein [Chryseobacterium takakiae]|nr:hypothetical protein [Chryseobacterium takakiae]
MKNLKILSRKDLKEIKGAASISKCPPGKYYCPETGVCIPFYAGCYIIVPDLPAEEKVSQYQILKSFSLGKNFLFRIHSSEFLRLHI